MTVLITGVSGLIGSNVARMLAESGTNVVGIDVAPPSAQSVIAEMSDRIRFVQGSVADLARLLNVVSEYRVESIVHTAVIIAGHANARPVEATRVNVEGTLNVLEAARVLKLRRVVCCSSSSVSGEQAGRPMSMPLTETDIDWPYGSYYAMTKLMNEGQVHLYRKMFGVDTIACRPARIWGPGFARWAEAFPLSLMVRDAVEGRPIRMERGGDTLVDYTYVKDHVRGLIQALEVQSTESCVFNLSGGRLVPLAEIAQVLRRLFPELPIEVGPGTMDDLKPAAPGEVKYKAAIRPAFDISRAKREFGYEPEYGIERGIPAYVAWLKNREYL